MQPVNFDKLTHGFLLAATKLGQGNVFTGVCDSVHRGGVCLSACWDTPHPPGADPHGSRHHPPEQIPPEQTPPREADSGIRSTSGRYASYWNAFLLLPPANVVCESYVFTRVCHSFCSQGGFSIPGGFSIWGGSPSRGGSPSQGGFSIGGRGGSPSGQCAGGTHPTGMHSCVDNFLKFTVDLKYT